MSIYIYIYIHIYIYIYICVWALVACIFQEPTSNNFNESSVCVSLLSLRFSLEIYSYEIHGKTIEI